MHTRRCYRQDDSRSQLLNDVPAFARNTARTTVLIERITKETNVIPRSDNPYCLTALYAPAAMPSKRSEDRANQQEPQADSHAPAHLFVDGTTIDGLPHVQIEHAATQRPKRSRIGVLSLRLSSSSLASTTAGGGGGLRPSKLDRGFSAAAARKYVAAVAITTSTTR